MKININKKSFSYGMLSGGIFGLVFIIGLIVLLPQAPELMYFWASSMVAVFILLTSISVSKQSDNKIEDILDRVKRIEERLDGLHKK